MYFSNGEYKLSAMLEASSYPTVFWGTGADTPDSNEEEYTPRALWTSTGFMVRILPDFYAGPLLRLQHIRVEKTEEGGLMDRGAVRGSDGTDIVGTGVTIQIDKRDSVFYPKKGYYLSLKGAVNRSEIGSEYDFLWSMTDFRKFIGIHGDHVLAFQTIAELSWGDVPIQSMGGLGGNMMMRGMLQNRYLDKCSLEAQAEYRFPIYWRFGGVAFAGAGEVQPALTDFNLKDIHTTWGGGLRFIVDREQHISLRLDMGVDDQGNVNAYFLVKEAF
jgi:outer membrane protein assembly factor BamA